MLLLNSVAKGDHQKGKFSFNMPNVKPNRVSFVNPYCSNIALN